MVKHTLSTLLLLACAINTHLSHCDVSAATESKWVVITSINHPTKAVKKLAALPDWHIVMVGDKKTPTDWHLDNCDYLSPEKQLELGFAITELLPWNHYSRKNIGYLYAIKNGATIIYDTDDDNILIQNSINYLDDAQETLIYDTQNMVVNTYAHFGQASIWPRGYPLDKVQDKQSVTIKTATTHPYIQQGLADLDPDVDAIYRLTQGVGNVIFNQHAKPITLPQGTFCPFNTQITIIHQQAFWALLIPITTKFRVCDIWRGYWAQRLLWDIGGNLCYMPPSVIQERNEHNLMHDFIDEIDLYTKAGPLVQFLKEWKSTQSNFFDRIIELTDAMAANDFYGQKESALVRAWLQDLQNIGYRQPEIIKNLN